MSTASDPYLTRGTETEPAILHGYTLNDIHDMARSALTADRLMAMSSDERYDIAWSAIAEQLVAAEETPSWQSLVRVGWQAIYKHVRDGLRERGYADGARDWASGDPTMPRYVQFWGAGVTPSHEDSVVERIAAQQVFQAVSGPYRDAVMALAVLDDYGKAAEALSIKYTALTARLTVARRAFLRHWHEGETPRRTKRTDRRVEVRGVELASHCGKGHEWTPENTYTRHRLVRGKARRERVCRACEHDRSQARYADRSPHRQKTAGRPASDTRRSPA
jgi:hypothetical protein